MIVALVLAVAGCVLIAGAGAVREEAQRRAEENVERIRRALAADQRPRHGVVTAASRARHPGVTGAQLVEASLEDAIAADVRKRFVEDRADQPVARCERLRPARSDGRPLVLRRGNAYFGCFATVKIDRYAVRNLETGYRFRARADLAAGTFAWCKLNPRPIHPDQEEFISVPLSRECVPAQPR